MRAIWRRVHVATFHVLALPRVPKARVGTRKPIASQGSVVVGIPGWRRGSREGEGQMSKPRIARVSGQF